MKKTVHLFFGEDTGSAEEKLLAWKTEFIKKYGDLNVVILESEEVHPPEFRSQIESVPFLSDKRLMIMKDFLERGSDTNQKAVADMLEHAPDHTILLLSERIMPDRRKALFKKIAKVGELHEFSYLELSELIEKVLAETTKRKGEISGRDAEYLIGRAGPDTIALRQEIEKLCLYTKGRPMTRNDIDALVAPNLTGSIFHLTDSLAEKNPSESLKAFHCLVESGEELTKIFYMMVRHFRILLQVSDAVIRKTPQPELSSKLGLHPYVMKTALSQCKNFSMEKLKAVYGALFEIETRLKTGRIRMTTSDQTEFLIAIEKFIVEHCAKSATKNRV